MPTIVKTETERERETTAAASVRLRILTHEHIHTLVHAQCTRRGSEVNRRRRGRRERVCALSSPGGATLVITHTNIHSEFCGKLRWLNAAD